MHVVYVVPFCLEATLRFVAGAAQIPGIVLSLLTQDPESKLPPEWRLGIRAHWQVRDAGRRAVRALGLRTGMTHLEWFRRPDGGLAISEVAARPPGAQFTSLLSYAHELDFYAAWPRLVATGRFAAPERRWAVGAAYVRGGARVACAASTVSTPRSASSGRSWSSRACRGSATCRRADTRALAT